MKKYYVLRKNDKDYLADEKGNIVNNSALMCAIDGYFVFAKEIGETLVITDNEMNTIDEVSGKFAKMNIVGKVIVLHNTCNGSILFDTKEKRTIPSLENCVFFDEIANEYKELDNCFYLVINKDKKSMILDKNFKDMEINEAFIKSSNIINKCIALTNTKNMIGVYNLEKRIFIEINNEKFPFLQIIRGVGSRYLLAQYEDNTCLIDVIKNEVMFSQDVLSANTFDKGDDSPVSVKFRDGKKGLYDIDGNLLLDFSEYDELYSIECEVK